MQSNAHEPSHADRVVIISGGVRGIGRALAAGFLEAGARVVAFHRGIARPSREADDDLRASYAEGSRLTILRADVTSAEDRARVLSASIDRFGRVDVLINNAGVCYREDLTEDRLHEQSLINATAPIAFAREAAKHMRRNEHVSAATPTRGAILAISSYVTEWTSYSSDYLRHYAESKRDLERGMRDLALELRPNDINVNVIAVGVIYAGMGLATIGRKEEALQAGQLPVTKFADVDSVVFEALCLAHPRSHYKTGRTAVLDGGWNLGDAASKS